VQLSSFDGVFGTSQGPLGSSDLDYGVPKFKDPSDFRSRRRPRQDA